MKTENKTTQTTEPAIAVEPVLATGLCCEDCETEMELTDTTVSNLNTSRAYAGQHTGNVYYCAKCGIFWLENFLNGSKLERWSY